uniref:Uncharacterized protein n=1 Tax=Timema douglasi TaxID=61478 RepID=A0A7R8VMB2_TIMDO|nr:unnamed protein product [Timema douglasi]
MLFSTQARQLVGIWPGFHPRTGCMVALCWKELRLTIG